MYSDERIQWLRQAGIVRLSAFSWAKCARETVDLSDPWLESEQVPSPRKTAFICGVNDQHGYYLAQLLLSISKGYAVRGVSRNVQGISFGILRAPGVLSCSGDQSEDFVIATGINHSLGGGGRLAFAEFVLDWRGHEQQSETLFRPTDLLASRADPGELQRKLGWHVRTRYLILSRK